MAPPHFASYEDYILTGRGGRGGFGRGRGRGGRGGQGQQSGGSDRGGGRGRGSARGGRGGFNHLDEDFPVVEPPPPSTTNAKKRNKRKNRGKGIPDGHDDFDGLEGDDDELIEVDFNDLGNLLGLPQAGPTQSNPPRTNPVVLPPAPPPAPVYRGRGGPHSYQRGDFNSPRGRGGRDFVPPSRGYQHGFQNGRGHNRGGYHHTDDIIQDYNQKVPAYQPRGIGSRGGRGGRGGRGYRGGYSGGGEVILEPLHDDVDAEEDHALQNLVRRTQGKQNNPYLRPIKFVQSDQVLFEDKDEIFMPEMAEVDTQNPDDAVPTADRVEQIFHPAPVSPLVPYGTSSSDSETEEQDEIDVDLSLRVESLEPKEGDLSVLVEATAALNVARDDEIETAVASSTLAVFEPAVVKMEVTEESTAAVIDAEGNTNVVTAVVETTVKMEVTDAPLSSEIILAVVDDPAPGTLQSASSIPEDIIIAPRSLFKAKRSKRQRQPGTTGRSKRQRKVEVENLHRRPMFKNSDIEWSTGSEEEMPAPGGGRKLADAEKSDDDEENGMDVDPEIDGDAYASLVTKLVGDVRLNQVSAGDLDDARKIAEEDAECNSGSPRQPASVLAVEEIEDDDGDDQWVDESSASDSPDDGLPTELKVQIIQALEQAKGKKRGKSRGKGKERAVERNEDSDDEVDENGDSLFIGKFQWDENDTDPDAAGRLQDLLDQNADIMTGRANRKARNKLFNMIRDGNFLADDELLRASIKKKKKHGKVPDWVPQELEGQWEQDRQKKAENKRKRAEARRLAMSEPSPGRKKGKKAKIFFDDRNMDIDADADSEDSQPNVLDVWEVEQQIRRFVRDLSQTTFQLPPMDNASRKQVHTLAATFNLKSKSTGSGNNRATTLTRTTKTGLFNVKEQKVASIMRSWELSTTGGKTGGRKGGKKGRGGGGGGSGGAKHHHREGEVVGQHAAKITEENVGYRLLQSMGWSEGDRMGVTASGLEVPLKAVFKTTKLGLGASTPR